MRRFFCTVFYLFSFLSFAQQISVSEDFTVAELVKDVLVNSNCAETSNYRSFTGTDFGINGIGYFNKEESRFPYAEGIVLSTGYAIDAVGPNDDIKDSGVLEWPGDEDLKSIARIANLFNATYIQFDFVPLTNSFSFNFLFASEEYSEDYQCEFSDSFAFILTDSNGNSKNLAIVPNSNSTVSATSVRPGVPDVCEPRNEDFFGGINGSNSSISMTGQTKSLTAKSEVIPGESYTIKLVIADNLDIALDSAVFLEGDSFSLDVSLGEDRTISQGNPLCIGDVYTLDATSVGAQHYRWYSNGERLTQYDDVAIITVSDDISFAVEVEFSPQCVSKGRIELEFITPPTIESPPLDLDACTFSDDDLDLPVVDLTLNTPLIMGGQNPEIYGVHYFTELSDAQEFINEIRAPQAYTFQRTQEIIIYARISSGTSCFETISFSVNVRNLNFLSVLKDEYVLCLDTQGQPIAPRPELDTGLSPDLYSFQWYKDAVLEKNLIASETNPNLVASETGSYFTIARNIEFGCETILSTHVISSEPPIVFEVLVLSDIFSNEGIVELRAEGNSPYRFAVDTMDFSENQIFGGLAAGEYTAYVTDVYGCSVISKDFLIVDYPRFFTPNGDGINDTWKIFGLSELNNSEIKIFDRFGVLLTTYENDSGWNGTTNGKPLPSSDYWFKLTYTNSLGEIKEFKSHFSLKR
ncbi:choice-of-anchor L domain-containing protein [Croceitalea rosinachiae]|uniref:Choice-of-anchor L domain-containing protein n=1 Tax=Croceitalea rosinachiae TaxID=3075596 RepID=A0ABU3ADH1_9FLAO|nr:choice-of-anchor L domain-containing protein [Croceitalea sp. F388]MDT0608231.1 choice-of-anchor L domain-containing protein [Croceitalea sp. F388]